MTTATITSTDYGAKVWLDRDYLWTFNATEAGHWKTDQIENVLEAAVTKLTATADDLKQRGRVSAGCRIERIAQRARIELKGER